MIELLVTAMASGSGKTIVTCGMLQMLKNKGFDPCAFKCGPDYIDPMFHRSVLGMPSHNLDLFLMREDQAALKAHYQKYKKGHDAVITEGVMGYYDGLGGITERGSTYAIGCALGLPALLTATPKGSSFTLAACIQGVLRFKKESNIRAVFLNNCTEDLYRMLAPVISEETGLPVVGYLPPMKEAKVESRHLGLYTAGEITDLAARIDAVAYRMEKSTDLDKLCGLFESGSGSGEKELADVRTEDCRGMFKVRGEAVPVRIAVARDEAFCFLYEETLELLRDLGAEPVFFSPLRDRMIPADCRGLILPGGYPELYAKNLTDNISMRQSVCAALQKGVPCIAECGGMMYLQKSMEGQDGIQYPAVGFFGGSAEKKSRLVRFGYAELTADEDSLLFRQGETIPVHEFHYYDTTQNGCSLSAVKPLSGKSWRCCHTGSSLYAGFPHLYLAGNPVTAKRFLEACFRFSDSTDIICKGKKHEKTGTCTACRH